jgi:hypothetical protein
MTPAQIGAGVGAALTVLILLGVRDLSPQGERGNLSNDAAFLEAWIVSFENIGSNPDEFGIVPSVTANANATAAAAGINLDAANHLAGFLEDLRGFENGLALPNPVSPQTLALEDIQFNWPYAGPFAGFALMAGEQVALDRVQLPPTSS